MILMFNNSIKTVNDISIVLHPEIGYGFKIDGYYYFYKLFKENEKEVVETLLSTFKTGRIQLTCYKCIDILNNDEVKAIQAYRDANINSMAGFNLMP